jgi:hypothetical protein
MDIYELVALKTEYERELVKAEAKVAVINDIIDRFQATEHTATENADVAPEITEY